MTKQHVRVSSCGTWRRVWGADSCSVGTVMSRRLRVCRSPSQVLPVFFPLSLSLLTLIFRQNVCFCDVRRHVFHEMSNAAICVFKLIAGPGSKITSQSPPLAGRNNARPFPSSPTAAAPMPFSVPYSPPGDPVHQSAEAPWLGADCPYSPTADSLAQEPRRASLAGLAVAALLVSTAALANVSLPTNRWLPATSPAATAAAETFPVQRRRLLPAEVAGVLQLGEVVAYEEVHRRLGAGKSVDGAFERASQ